ncbi:MAG: hypothetical protein P3W90_004320 [Paracoccus sp. (in: a-proteobacteria)]|nr:hypothetical protein [Paracoccus sp. (in: a-proteobacteria)]
MPLPDAVARQVQLVHRLTQGEERHAVANPGNADFARFNFVAQPKQEGHMRKHGRRWHEAGPPEHWLDRRGRKEGFVRIGRCHLRRRDRFGKVAHLTQRRFRRAIDRAAPILSHVSRSPVFREIAPSRLTRTDIPILIGLVAAQVHPRLWTVRLFSRKPAESGWPRLVADHQAAGKTQAKFRSA